jgi:hypothetical protein
LTADNDEFARIEVRACRAVIADAPGEPIGLMHLR